MITRTPNESPENSLFDVLGEVFELEPQQALALGKRVVTQFASYVADMAAVSGDASAIDAALREIQELEMDLFALSSHLEQFRNRDPEQVSSKQM